MRVVMIALMVLLAFTANAEECPSIPSALQQAMTRHVTKIRAEEYCPGRVLKSNGELSVLIYTAEGACGDDTTQEPGTCSVTWVRYMVGLYKGKIVAPIIVGGKGDLCDKKVSISKGIVTVSGLEVGPSDAFCCPSVPAKKMFKVSEGHFVEVTP